METMTTPMITVSVIGAILLLLMIVFLLQMRERMRDDKARQVNLSTERYRRLQLLLDEVPVAYIPLDVRALLLTRLIQSIKELQALNKRSDLNADTQKATEEIQRIKSGAVTLPDENSVVVKDEKHALEVRKLLKVLYHFIEVEKREGGLDNLSASKYLSQTAFLIARTSADVHTNKAQLARAAKKYRVAIHHLHNAIEVMEKIAKHPSAQQCLKQYREQIKILDKMATEEIASQGVQPKVEETEQSNTTLSSEWDKLLTEQDKWKKKQEYD